MRAPGEALAGWLAAAGVRRGGWIVALTGVGAAALLALSAGQRSEVGYAAYFGPASPELRRLQSHLDEFEIGAPLLLVFGCRESPRCERVDEPWALAFLARLHAIAEQLPNVRRVASAWTVPVVLGPLDARPIAAGGAGGRFALAADWRERFAAGLGQPGFAGVVVAPDARAAGVVMELASIESDALRATVRAALALRPELERELGAELHLAGDPLWTVVSADSLEHDSRRLTALMFAAMLLVLWLLFRDPWLAGLPLLAVATVTIGVEGAADAFGLPRTSLLAALPPLLVAIAIAGSIHLLTAVARAAPAHEPGPLADPAARRDAAERLLVSAARDVGEGCFWSAVTTAAGFASFLASDLASFRHFGGLAAAGVAAAFAVQFALLPALLGLRLRRRGLHPRARRGALAREVLGALHETVTCHPRFVVAASLGTLGLLGLGATRLHYASDFGFGEGSYVVRSLRAIEANFRKPMTTDVVVTLPPGHHAWQPAALGLLARVEAILATEPSTGATWSFLDLLDEAHRLDRGRPAGSFEALIASAPRGLPLLAASEHTRWFWNEHAGGGRERLRVSVDRAWLDDADQGPYVARVGARLAALAREPAALGAEIELAGGLLLADRFVSRLRETQRESFAAAFLVVAATLGLLLRGPARLIGWAVAVNVLPVLALLGLMGWAGIGVDPANTMVGAILLALGVDDTLHVALRVRAAQRAGRAPRDAVADVFASVGEAVLATSLCLAVGFSVLLFSQWGGLVSFGLVASLGVALLLAGDVLLLSAALLAGQRRGAAR